MTKPFLLFSCICLSAACAVIGEAPDPPDEPEPTATCSDPRYDDGVCNTDLACGEIPDIDCYRTFVDDTAAALWFAEREANQAQRDDRDVRALLAPSDPRFVEMRALLDAGWKAFSSARPVGELAELRPALVMIEDPGANAFVTAESATQRQVFAVMVQTGLHAAPLSEDARIGILLHELQHIAGTHGLPGVEEKMRVHYVADASEPIGRLKSDDPAVHAAIAGWMNMAEDVGPYSASQLGGFPYRGMLWDVLDMLVDNGMRIDPRNCQNAADRISSLRSALADSRDALDGHLTISLADLPLRVSAALGALRNDCMPGVSLTFVEALADFVGASEGEVADSMSDRDLQLVNGKHVVDAIATLAVDRRRTMQTLEGSLSQSRPWSSARYFSDEEDADDVAVMVLRASGRDPESYADAAVSAVAKRGLDAAERCEALLTAGTVPRYGVDLLDTHHANCWRAFHALQIAKLPKQGARHAPQTPVALPDSLRGLPQPPPPELVIHE